MSYARGFDFATEARLRASRLQTELAAMRAAFRAFSKNDLAAGAIFGLQNLAHPAAVVALPFTLLNPNAILIHDDTDGGDATAENQVESSSTLATIYVEREMALRRIEFRYVPVWREDGGVVANLDAVATAELDFFVKRAGNESTSRLGSRVDILTLAGSSLVRLDERSSPALLRGRIPAGSTIEVRAYLKRNETTLTQVQLSFSAFGGVVWGFMDHRT